MIVSLSVLLSRAVRKRIAVPIIAVSSPEVLRAALEGSGAPYLAVLVDLKQLDAPLMLATLHWLAERHTCHIAIIVSQSGDEKELDAFPNVTLLLPLGSGYRGLRSHIAVAPALIDPPSLDELLTADGALAVMLPGTVTSGYVAEVCRMIRLPILLGDEIGSSNMLRLLLRAGISGLMIRTQLDQAYTAALRTALHNREHSNPSDYACSASLAVRERIKSFADYL